MNKAFKFTLLKVGLFLLVVSLVACSNSEQAGNESDTESDITELRWFMWTGSPAEKEVWESLAAKVTEKYPNIVVNFETAPFSGYWDKLTTQISSGTAADIISLQSLRTPTFAQYDAFEPLGSYIEKDSEFDINDFQKSALEGLTHNGEQLAIPYDYGPYILYYNKDIFDKYGVEYPSSDMNWERFLEKAKDLTQDEDGDGEPDTYGFVFQNNIDQIVPFIWSNGGKYMNEDKTQSLIQEPAATKAIQFLGDLMNRHKVAMPITDPGNENFYREQFYSGKAAMYLDGPWNFGNVRSKANFDWDITTVPAGETKSTTWVAGSGFGINAESEHKEEAWKALSVMLSKEGQELTATSGRGYPARESSVETFKSTSDTPENIEAIAKSGENAIPFRVTTNWQETQAMLKRELDKVWFNNVPADEVTKEIETLFNKLLKQHQKNISD